MFGLFKKTPKGPEISYQVYCTEVAKYKLMIGQLKSYFDSAKHIIVLCFFKETYDQMRQLLEASGVDKGDFDTKLTLSMAEDSTWYSHGLETQIVLAELYPLEDLIQHTLENYKGEHEIICHVSADNALFNLMSGGRLLSLFDSLGVGQDDSVNHSMIDKAIQSIQRKTSQQINNPIPADSLEEWVKINKPS